MTSIYIEYLIKYVYYKYLFLVYGIGKNTYKDMSRQEIKKWRLKFKIVQKNLYKVNIQ